MPYYFTIGEANKVLPKVEKIIHEVRFWKRRSQELRQALAEESTEVAQRRKLRTSYLAAQRKMREALERLESIGCLVRDIEVGLIDFPALRFGEIVYLCWREGEDQLQYWHGPKEAFAGRKPLAANMEALV